MTRPLALIGMASLVALFGWAKMTFGLVTLIAFLTGYATARMQRAD